MAAEAVCVDGVEGKKTIQKTQQDGMTIYILGYLMVKNNRQYMFTFSSDEEDFMGLESEAGKIMETVKLD